MPIAIVNQSGLAIGFVAGQVESSGFHLTTIVKGAFKLVPEGMATLAEQPLLGGDAHLDDEPAATCIYGSDFAPFKPKADVVATGTCHLPRGVSQGVARVALSVGSMRKALAVYGDRHFVERKLGGWDISEPKPLRSFPLHYESAFGGAGYASNPVGKGFAPSSPAAGRALPNVESPARLIKTPDDRPEPAGFGPLNRRWGLRAGKTGTYDEAWTRDRWPDFPLDFDWSYFNAAPTDQQVGYLEGDELIAVEGMHPEIARYESRLPAVRPRCFLQKVGQPPIEVVLRLDTVAIDMDAESLVLVWRGLTSVWSRDYAEVERALLVAESRYDKPLPPAAYHAESYWRPGAPSLEEQALVDEAAARGDRPKAAPPPAVDDDVPPPAELAEVEAARADLVKAGADAALLERLHGVTRLIPFSRILQAHLDEKLPDDAKAEVADAQKAPDAAAAPAAAPKSTAAARREDRVRRDREELAAMRADLAAKGASPGLLEKLAPVTVRADFMQILLGEMPGTGTAADAERRAELVASIAAADAQLDAADAADEAAERAERGERLTRAEVVAMAAAKASFEKANLTELDLSGLDLSKLDFTKAVLVGAKLERARLEGADLTGATLRMADLRGAALDDAVATGADLGGAKLGGATARRAIFHHAKLENASLEGANLDEADFSSATLAYANLGKASVAAALFDDAMMERASLRGVTGPKASFRGAKLTSAELVGAKLDAALFVGAVLDGVEAGRASLRRAHLDGCSGNEVSFVEASLTGLRAQDASLPKARFTKVSAEGARFAGSVLTAADFSGAHLVEADFSGASLVDASFHLARLDQANLTKAKLVGARLTQVNLFRGRLGGAALVDADCRSSNFFECELFEADVTRARFDRTNLKRTCLDRGSR